MTQTAAFPLSQDTGASWGLLSRTGTTIQRAQPVSSTTGVLEMCADSTVTCDGQRHQDTAIFGWKAPAAKELAIWDIEYSIFIFMVDSERSFFELKQESKPPNSTHHLICICLKWFSFIKPHSSSYTAWMDRITHIEVAIGRVAPANNSCVFAHSQVFTLWRCFWVKQLERCNYFQL